MRVRIFIKCEFKIVKRLCKFEDFFFQAEDGIRDTSVTGVQTCALPIWKAIAAPRSKSVILSPLITTKVSSNSSSTFLTQPDRKSVV